MISPKPNQFIVIDEIVEIQQFDPPRLTERLLFNLFMKIIYENLGK